MPVVRIELRPPEERVKELEDLISSVGIASKSDLLNDALTLFRWAVRERSSGRIIASVDAENQRYKVLEMPSLENAATPARPVSAAF